MKLLKLTILSSLLFSTLTFANGFERLTNKVGSILAYPPSTTQKTFKEIIIDIASTPPSPSTITELTNLDTGNYVWHVSYHPYGSYEQITLLNPHPTLEVLNQRALQLAKTQVTPPTEADKQALKAIFSDKSLQEQKVSIPDDRKKALQPLLVQFTDQDIQTITAIKHEMQVEFLTFNENIDKMVEQYKDVLQHTQCSSYTKGYKVINGTIRIKIDENGRVAYAQTDIDDILLNICLTYRLKNKKRKFMIFHKDGVPTQYVLNLPFVLHVH